MLAHYLNKLMHMQLNKRAVTSLEYGMIAMVVAIASVGAVNYNNTNAAPAPLQVASAK